MTATLPRPKTLDELYEELSRVEGKAEIINGRIVELPLTGDKPSYAAFEIAVSLRAHTKQTETDRAVQDGAGFKCDLPNRHSFSPDAAYYTGPPGDMGFFPEPPVFAVEVRSENDYGPAAERAIRAKIADYFAAGTLVVWDVDLQNDEVIAKYTTPNAVTPQIFRRGDVANAEPAVPGWRLEVNELLPG